jgi:hypothetical protein
MTTSSIYLSGHDLREIARHGHWIPAGRGITRSSWTSISRVGALTTFTSHSSQPESYEPATMKSLHAISPTASSE